MRVYKSIFQFHTRMCKSVSLYNTKNPFAVQLHLCEVYEVLSSWSPHGTHDGFCFLTLLKAKAR